MDMTLEKPASVMLMQANLIHELCKPLFDSSGIAYFAYVEIFENGDFIFLNSDAKLYSALLKTKVVQRLPYKILHHPIRLGLQLADLESESYFADPEISHFLKTFNLGSLFRFATLETGVRGLSLRLYTYAGKANQTESNYYCINNLDYFRRFNEYMDGRMDRFLCSITRLNPAPELIKPIVTRFREFVSAQKSKSDLLSMISGSDKGIDKPLSVLSPKLTIPLSPREKDIVFLMTKGMTAEQTALELKISKRTVERHFENLRRKLKCKSKGQIINRLVEHGFTMPDLVTE